ncbi:hypothetical protein MJN69_28735, partial [Salmonella enterica subsp. enterica serovar Kentucky]|nr:hypothetical protein [Salmonella enterica subsp. enterica serovar Kentucky]
TILFNMIKKIFNIATIWPSPFAFMCPVNLTWNISNISILFNQVEEAYRKIEADFTPEKTQQLMLLLDDLIALGRQHPDSEAEA